MKTSKRLLLPFVLLLTMGFAGLGLALWTETLTINGTVDTGELKMEFTTNYSSDDGPGKNDPKAYPGPTRWDVNVGETKIALVDPHTTRITISNVYPGYQARIWLVMLNTGTISAKIQSVTLTNIVDPNGVQDYVKVGGWVMVQTGPSSWSSLSLASGYPPTWGCLLKDFDGVLYNALKLTHTKPLKPGWNVYFGCENPEEGDSLGFYILPGAPEGGSLSFDLVLTWTQSNA